jgi:hypothetical protein
MGSIESVTTRGKWVARHVKMPRHHKTGVAFGEPDRENRVVSLDGRIGPS